MVPFRIEDGQEITLCSVLESPVVKESGFHTPEPRLVVPSTEYDREAPDF